MPDEKRREWHLTPAARLFSFPRASYIYVHGLNRCEIKSTRSNDLQPLTCSRMDDDSDIK